MRSPTDCGINVSNNCALSCRLSVVVMLARSPTLFRKAFHIKGDDDLRWVTLTYALQVF